MRVLIYWMILASLLAVGCESRPGGNVSKPVVSEKEPEVREDGRWVEFPTGSSKPGLFRTARAENRKLTLSLSAPANVVARVHYSGEAAHNKIILFDTPDLTSVYSAYLQNVTLLKTAKINFGRVNDLYKNGAATGKEMNDVSTELMNIETALASGEAQLRESGLNPENLGIAPAGVVWLICDLPESELNTVRKGQKYNLLFPGFPNEVFVANIDVIADVMNSQTRKVRVRLSMTDPQNKIRPGMYAQVNFEAPHEGLMVPRQSVFSANALYYLFVKKSGLLFERREVSLSSEAGDYIEISQGLQPGEEVVTGNVYLLKGISSGI